MSSQDTMAQSKRVGQLLYDTHKQNGGRSGTGDLVIDWAKEVFWGLRMQDTIKDFKELWQKLTDNGNVSRDTAIYYGDGDQYVWAEQLDKNTKLIINHDVVTCADDNTIIYSMKDYDFDESEGWEGDVSVKKLLFEFHIMTAFEEEKKCGDTWGDRRDYDKFSLQTYRERGFDFGYGDGRDKEHVAKLRYDHTEQPRVEKAHWTENRIGRELDELSRFNFFFEEEKDNR